MFSVLLLEQCTNLPTPEQQSKFIPFSFGWGRRDVGEPRTPREVCPQRREGIQVVQRIWDQSGVSVYGQQS